MSKDSRIARWGAQHVSGAQPREGRLALSFDDVRVSLSELSDGRLLAQARIVDLPLAPGRRETLVQRAMQCSLARLGSNSLALVADAEEAALWLQGSVEPTATDMDISAMVERLINEIQAWREVLCAR